MYRAELQDDEDLRLEIFHLKKQLSNISAENHLLKVKIRKLQNEIIKKDKQMDVVLDPRKSPDVRKILYERSASFVLNMKEKNDELLNILQEKDTIIRRLQKQADVTKLYSQSSKKILCKCSDHIDLDTKIRQIQQKIPCFKNDNFPSDDKKRKGKSLSWTAGLQEAETTLIEEESEVEEENTNIKFKSQSSNYDIKDQYRSLSRDHLLSIIENLKNNQRYSPTSHQSSRKSSPESDLERIELLCESPHEEIQQLHLHFLDMLTEVDYLKGTISQLQNSQEKTEHVLRKKNGNIDKLAQEIKNLKRPKSKLVKNRKCYNNADVIARVYSASSLQTNRKSHKSDKEKRGKNHEKSNNNKMRADKVKVIRQTTKDAITQVDKLDSPESVNQCIYVEKGSITFTQKKTSDKEYEYEDEVFEECDEKTD